MLDPSMSCEIVLVQVPCGRSWHAQAVCRSDILNGRYPRSGAGCRNANIPDGGVVIRESPPMGAPELDQSSNDTGAACSTTDQHRASQAGWILDDPDVQDQVIRIARGLRSRCRDDSSDLKDHEQDLRLYLIQWEHKYDAARGSVGAFVCVLLDSYVKMHIRSRLTRRRRGRLPLARLSEDTDLDSRVDPGSNRDLVEQRDLLEACVERLSPQEIRSVLLIVEAGQVLACEALEESRRQIRSLLKLVSETCADLEPFSE